MTVRRYGEAAGAGAHDDTATADTNIAANVNDVNGSRPDVPIVSVRKYRTLTSE